ncbi:hypothetical protein [Desulfosporosinus sp.]|uniref:hypothetical protein n=1 Tax=Desulfosporosinus sp. TaxID=157907 RepID=UPI0025C0C1C0|nr:hypothetical protein [Desulfosporosinus sp.]MBC2725849.1 hypothetical protein [Desulfosporosinus sp.]
MNETSKCSQCIHKELCHIRSRLNRIIQEVIRNSEDEVQQLSPKEIDYMIYTDISIIPTRCENYKCRQVSSEERKGLFRLRRTMATAAV